MPVYKLTIAYDGTSYHGWQKQPGQSTLQEILEKVLSRLTKESVSLTAAGRTDAGVHAQAQVAHFRSTQSFNPDRILRSANALLPEDIAIKQIEEAPPSFHARASATQKTYRYFIHNGPARSPHERQIVWHVPRPLKIHPMRAAARHLTGKHDFTSLVATDRTRQNKDYSLEMKEISVRKKGDKIILTFMAPRFFQHMVRNVVGLLVEVGRGKRSASEIPSILQAKDRRWAGPTAPPHGLFLIQVNYAGEGLPERRSHRSMVRPRIIIGKLKS